MAPFDAGFIQDEALQIAVRGAAAPTAAANVSVDFGQFGMGSWGTTVPTYEMSDMLTAPALRDIPMFERILHNAGGPISLVFFVGIYLALISAT